MHIGSIHLSKKSLLGLLAVVILLFAAIVLWLNVTDRNTEKAAKPEKVIRLAFVGPMTGEGSSEGRLMSQAVSFYVDQINKQGGLNGIPVVLDIFDDKNDAEEARRQAIKIAEANKYLAVIGHWYSSASLSGGEVYKKYQIPVITPGSADPRITENNPWYFRAIYNANLPARFLVHYINKVLEIHNVSIIYDTDAYGLSMAEPFMHEVEKLGLNIKHEWKFDSMQADKEEEITRIADELEKVKDDVGVLFMPVYAAEAVRLVKKIKDRGFDKQIIGPSSFSEDTFQKGFADFPKEIFNPGFYTNNILVLVPLLFEVANREAQIFLNDFQEKYKHYPSWGTAYAYDSADILLTAAKMAEISGKPDQLQEDRNLLRAYMSGIKGPEDAILGVTGLNYFDNERNARKPITLSRYRNNQLSSALIQLQNIKNPESIYRLEKELDKGRIILIDDQYMFKTEIVYTGIEIKNITDFDPVEQKHTLHFNMWFRYQGDFDPQDVEFVNALETINLGDPVEQEKGDINYVKYSTKGVFSIDYLEKPERYKEHTLGLSIKHDLLDRYNIIFIPDLLGMNINENHTFVEYLRTKNIAISGRDWNIANAFIYQKVIPQHSKGNPRYLNYTSSTADFSQLNFSILVNRGGINLGEYIPAHMEIYVAVITFILLMVSLLLFRKNRKQDNTNLTRVFFLINIPLFVLFLISVEVLVANQAIRTDRVNISEISTNFSIIWYFLSAYLINQAVYLFVWKPIETKSGKEIPKVLKQVIGFIIYMIAFFLVVAFVLQREVTALVATSGVLTAVIGLAIQANIADIFSGIAINMESPFKVGDWIKVGTDEGEVMDITWRTTRIKNGFGNMVMIPNSRISTAVIVNYHMPQSKYWYGFTVHTAAMHRPDTVEKILKDALSAVKEVEQPWVIFMGWTDWSADYWVYFWIDDYANRFNIQNKVWIKVWTVLNRAGIRPAVKQQDIHMFKGEQERSKKEAIAPITVLSEIDIFNPFSDEEKQALADSMKPIQFSSGTPIVEQGEQGESMFVIIEGVVSIEVITEDGKKLEVARLCVGDFFGEMSLLTGDSRSATVRALTATTVYEITKDDIKPLIQKNNEISEKLSRVLMERKLSNQKAVESLKSDDLKKKQENLYKNILSGIKTFFGLS